jgi:DNA-binding transcriptional ArsR family regulator
MPINSPETAVSSIAAAIGEPARARILYALSDGRARTSTELSILAEVSPPTASAHLQRLTNEHLISVLPRGRYRYYSLGGPSVAAALEALSVLAGVAPSALQSSTPVRLRLARTCYDHLAGSLGVALHDRLQSLEWLSHAASGYDAYDLTSAGVNALEALGVDVVAMRALRRRFAFACIDWSERRPHIGGALGAVLLSIALKKGWVLQDLDSRALEVTARGRLDLLARFGLSI